MGRHRIGLVAPEGAPLVENRPRDASELVGERNGEHIVVESLLRRLNPRFESETIKRDKAGLRDTIRRMSFLRAVGLARVARLCFPCMRF
jgi:hypothetical protein